MLRQSCVVVQPPVSKSRWFGNCPARVPASAGKIVRGSLVDRLCSTRKIAPVNS
jgi:hypothetical protein